MGAVVRALPCRICPITPPFHRWLNTTPPNAGPRQLARILPCPPWLISAQTSSNLPKKFSGQRPLFRGDSPVSNGRKKTRQPIGLAGFLMVGVARIELATPAMSTQCSTTELYAHSDAVMPGKQAQARAVHYKDAAGDASGNCRNFHPALTGSAQRCRVRTPGRPQAPNLSGGRVWRAPGHWGPPARPSGLPQQSR